MSQNLKIPADPAGRTQPIRRGLRAELRVSHITLANHAY